MLRAAQAARRFLRPRTGFSPSRAASAALLMLTLAETLRAQCPDGSPPPCAGARAPLPTVAIQPFTSLSRDTAEAYRAWTLTEDLTAALAAASGVRVLSGNAGARAEWQLSGSVQRTGDIVRYAARLDRRGEIRWTTRLQGPASDESLLRDSLATLILTALGVAPQPTRVTAARPPDPAAYDLWLRGRYHYPRRRDRDVAEGVGLLRQAVARDSTFAAGWADLARALEWAHRFGFRVPGIPSDSLLSAALAASERSLLLDSSAADAWLLRAMVARSVDPTSNAAPIAALRRALALDSADVETWRVLAQVLDESGDSAGAAAAFRRAWTLEPDRPPPMAPYHFYWYGRRLDTAAVIAARLVAADPRLMFFRELQAEFALARGRLGEAQAAYEAALRLGNGREQVRALAGLAATSAALGDSARARELVARAEDYLRTSEFTSHDAIALAGAYAALGEADRALGWLERYQPRADLHFQIHLRDMPLDPLRAQPRFRQLQAPPR